MATRKTARTILAALALGLLANATRAQDFDDLSAAPPALGTRGAGQNRGPGGMGPGEETEARDVRADQAAFDAAPVRVDYDIKASFRVKILWYNQLLSTGAGLRAQFSSGGAASGARNLTLVRDLVPAWGVVKYDDGDNRNFHVRQIQRGGNYQQLVKSGSVVVEDWKSHYDAMGAPAGDRPNQFGPAAIHNDYPVDPAGRFRFTVNENGVIPPASVSNRVQEASQDSRWLASSWPSLAKALGVFETGPLPPGGWEALPKSGTYRGADIGRSLGALYEAVKATIPQHAGRIPSTPFPAVVPQVTVSAQGSLLVLEASARAIDMGKGRLEELRRITKVDPALRRVVSDEIRVIVVTPGGRCEVKLGHRKA